MEPLSPARDFGAYISSVSDARYVMRTVSRIVDDCAKTEDLLPLEHQALIQIAGARAKSIPVNTLATRLDIAAGLASRIFKQLRSKGLVESGKHSVDKRISLIYASQAGIELLTKIDDDVRFALAAFQRELDDEEREAALMIFKLYVGASASIPAR